MTSGSVSYFIDEQPENQKLFLVFGMGMITFRVNNISDLYFARQCAICFTYMISLIFTQPYDIGILIHPLQLRKLRFRI